MYLQETEKSFLGYRTLAKIVYKSAMPHKSATTNKYTTINKSATLPSIARFMLFMMYLTCTKVLSLGSFRYQLSYLINAIGSNRFIKYNI